LFIQIWQVLSIKEEKIKKKKLKRKAGDAFGGGRSAK